MAPLHNIVLCWSFCMCINWAWCAPSETKTEKEAFREALAREMLSFMDQRADPCDNIYQFACGNFEAIHPIPADASKSNLFVEAFERVNVILRELIEAIPDSSERGTAGSHEAKMKRFYDSCMDRNTIDSRGTEPLTKLLQELGGNPDQSLEEFFAVTNTFYTGNIIRADVGVDIENPKNIILTIQHQAFDTLSKSDLALGYNSSTTEAYLKTLISVLKLFGRSSEDAANYAKELIDFELKVIELQPDPHAELRDSFDRLKFGEFVEMFPYFNWTEFLVKSFGHTVPADEEIFGETLQYFQQLPTLLQNTDPTFIKEWVLMKIAVASIGYLDQRFLDVQAEHTMMLTGASKADPIWKTCVVHVKNYFDMAIGALYASKYFGEDSRTLLQQVLDEIRQEIGLLIAEKEWLQQPTKQLALEKLAAVGTFVGYDDKDMSVEEREKEYKDYNIDSDRFFENIMNIKKIKWKENTEKLGKPSVKESPFKPAEVNAGLYLFQNLLTFPAGFLQPPNFHKYYPKAFTYAAIGSTMGHEFAHVFDEQGRHFNEKGEFKEWWDEASLAAYKEKTECFIEHYNQYTVHGHKVNGTISLGENMSDNTGLRTAYSAYKKWWQKNKDTEAGREEVLPGLGFNNYELFFLKYAQLWCDSLRPESVYVALQDEHPPGEVRVTGVFGNSIQFAEHFKCPLKHDICTIW